MKNSRFDLFSVMFVNHAFVSQEVALTNLAAANEQMGEIVELLDRLPGPATVVYRGAYAHETFSLPAPNPLVHLQSWLFWHCANMNCVF